MMRFFVAIKQALISAGRYPNRGASTGGTTTARSDQSLLQEAKIFHNFSQYETLETPNIHLKLKPRQADTPTTDFSTCGYLNGDASLPRTANSGFDCRVDTKNAIWGFCPTTILAVSNCGLVGGCVDAHACEFGCGISGNPTVTTFTWFVNLLSSAFANHFPDTTSALVYLIANTQSVLSG